MAFDFKSLFSGQAGTMAKGAMMAGGTGPVRMKKKPSLLGSIIGMLIGFVLVIGSPIAMWSAQSQHRAKDFQSAKQVEAASSESGYITFSGTPSYVSGTDGDDCYISSCLYQKESQQQLVKTVSLECGNNIQSTSTKKVLKQNGSECDENGNCTPCYDVENSDWKEINKIETTYPVQVGSYVVKTSVSATFLETEEKTVETGTDATSGNPTRRVYSYFVMPSTLLVAGDSDGKTVQGGEKIFVMSSFDHETTLSKLKAMDTGSAVLLMIATFFMLFFGIMLILGPLQWMGSMLRYIPIVGPMLAQATGIVIGLVSFAIAVPLWIILFVAIVVLKFWWLALIILAAIFGLVFWKIKSGKKAEGPAVTPPAAS